MMDVIQGLVGAATNSQPDLLWPVLIGLAMTFGLIWYFGGRFWALLYFVTIPFLNWSFGIIEPWTLVAPGETFAKGVELHPLTMVTGLVFVFRDFVQRGMGHKVLVVMALAIAWSFFYAWPVIALASGDRLRDLGARRLADLHLHQIPPVDAHHPVVGRRRADRHDDLPVWRGPRPPAASGRRAGQHAALGQLDRVHHRQDGRRCDRLIPDPPARGCRQGRPV